jgi:hypothetical protein
MTRSDFQVRRQPRRHSNRRGGRIDNFKKSQDMLGQNARQVSNAIDALKTKGACRMASR